MRLENFPQKLFGDFWRFYWNYIEYEINLGENGCLYEACPPPHKYLYRSFVSLKGDNYSFGVIATGVCHGAEGSIIMGLQGNLYLLCVVTPFLSRLSHFWRRSSSSTLKTPLGKF